MVLNAFLLIFGISIILTVFLGEDFAFSNIRSGDVELFPRSKMNSLKGIAAIMIVFAHIGQFEKDFCSYLCGGERVATYIARWGAVGVSIFFFLSGYGCFLSIKRCKSPITWVAKKITNVYCHYLVVVAFVFILRVMLQRGEAVSLTLSGILCFCPFGLRIWYLIIQILMYIFLAICSIFKDEKWITISTFVVVLSYTVVAKYGMNLDDYWWKTALCFPTGVFVSFFSEKIRSFSLGKIICIILLALLGA